MQLTSSRLKPMLVILTVCLSLDVGRCEGQLKDDSVPNIIIILADDLGFSDLGCYGSEILTPNLDELAKGGLRFTQFYNAGRCCPSRASLMTGLYPHQAGLGHMMKDHRMPGYRGNLNKSCVTIATLLEAVGYQTMMCGKWHLSRHFNSEGPKHTWPVARGFEKFYGTLHGGSYFDPPTRMRDKQFLRATGDYYYTDAISDQAGRFIEEAARSDKPFFLYVSYTAPHFPLQARPETIARYRGKYATGWDTIRQQRHRRQISMGIVQSNWPLTPRDARVGPWETAPYGPWQQRRMEVYAAQVDSMDRGIGRIIEKLRQVGAEKNTLVMFLSDNGGNDEEIGPKLESPSVPEKGRQGQPVQIGNKPNFMPGSEDTFQSYGIAWANASNTPFRLYKRHVHEGGIATPLIVYWPNVIREGGGLTNQQGHVIDLMATCLDVADTKYPKVFKGLPLTPSEGRSLLPIFQGEDRKPVPIFWEHEGHRAVRDGKWKLVSKFPGKWELYNMETDRTEMNNLVARYPKGVQYMIDLYNAWAGRANVQAWHQ